MDNMDRFIQKHILNNPDVIGVLAVRNASPFSPLLDGFDILLLIVTEQVAAINYTNHYSKDGNLIQERWMSKTGLQQWIVTGDNRSIIHWMTQGDIYFDRNGYMESMRKSLMEFPIELRQQKLFIEFSYLLRHYMQSKYFLKNGHVQDAYLYIVSALKHWARIAVIEQGFHPEMTVWQQVRKINPGVYKIHEELTLAVEPLDKRVELALIAAEFNVLAQMAPCCKLLIDVVKSREEPFTSNELKYHEQLLPLHVDMALVLKMLVKHGIIRQVSVERPESTDLEMLELRYTSL